MSATQKQAGTRAFLAGPLIAFTVLVEVAHLLTLTLFPHRVLASNLFQLLLPFIALCVSVHQRKFSVNATGRKCWSAMIAAFGIWTAAQALFIYFLYRPGVQLGAVRLDDALWVLFGLPVLLAINTSNDELDQAQWLDRAQAVLFFVVLYLLVFLKAEGLKLANAYLIQNFVLILCCLLRLPSCDLARERRFFIRLTAFLFAYGSMETIGDYFYSHGFQMGSPVDLIWTLPTACYIVLVLRDAKLPIENENAGRLLEAVGRAKGLSVAALSFLSVGISVMLADHRPVLGGVFVACCFVLFALRTNAREDAWQQAHSKLEETVLQDALTGLGNRICLDNNLSERLAAPAADVSIALFFLDLDHFKSINDNLGHALGDRLLIEVAKRLRAAAPKDSVVCRLGGDEFVVLASAKDATEAEECGHAFLEVLRRPYDFGEHTTRCSASVGVLLAKPGDATDDLLRTADHAMYRAKQLGKNRVQLFDASITEQMNKRWRMEADLRESIERDEIDVAFQPIMKVEGGDISGFEALARWTHSKHGNVPPCDFIPLAEDIGLIPMLGAQILEKACQQLAVWNQEWKTRLSVSVNVSPKQFADHGFLASVLAILEKTKHDPKLLRLEITESVLIVHQDRVKQILNEARAHGICIALDDFGTGYSSLSFLLNLPVDEVKVDRSFVSDMHRDPQRRELVRTVIQLGHSLGKRVVAEGVETENELRELAGMGCECAQGWLISRPLFAEAIASRMPEIEALSARWGNPSLHIAAVPPTELNDGWKDIRSSELTAEAVA